MSYAYQLVSATNDFPLIHFAVFPHCDEKHIALLLCFEDNTQDEFEVVYKDNGDDTVVGSGTNSLLVRGRSYIDVMKDDMLEIWTNAKFSGLIDVTLHLNQNVVENLETANGIYELIKTISEQQHRQFPVHTLFLDVVNHPQLPSILQCFDPNTLNHLAIALDMNYETSVAVDLTDIVEMDHWKKAKSLQILGYLESIPLEHFRHFQEIELQFRVISAKDIQNFLEVMIFLELVLIKKKFAD